jgi:hypothetical protein
MVKTIPREAFDDIGDAIGIRRNGTVFFETEDVSAVMADCCLYDWFENGNNLVQRYAETHPAEPGTDESFLLQAYCKAKYRIVVPQSAVPGAGLHCTDILNGGELFLMDVAMSQSVPAGKGALATRTIPLGDYWMTSGAGLPIHSGADMQKALSWIESEYPSMQGPSKTALAILRACLSAGAADYIAYEERKWKKPRREPRFPGFKRRRR